MTAPENELLAALHVDRRKNDVEWRLLVVAQIDDLRRELESTGKAVQSLKETVAETNAIMQTLARMDQRLLHLERVVLGASAALAIAIVGVLMPKIMAL